MEKIVTFIGAFLKHVVGILILCWRRMLRAGLIAFAIGVVLTLLVAVVSTGQAFPGVLSLVVALLFGAALAYGVAMTVFIEEFFLGVVDLIRLLEGDAEAVAHITTTMAEREIGDIGHGLRRLFGLPAPTRATPLAPTLPALPRYPAAPPPSATPPGAAPLVRDAAIAGVAGLEGAALTARAATPAPTAAAQPAPIESPAPTPPAEPLDVQAHPIGEPVRADQLPRIGWTMEHEAVRPTRSPLPDTLVELAGGAALAGASHFFGRHEAAAPTATAASEPLDVAVVSPLAAPQSTPLEDERLAEPTALTLPEEEEPAPHVDADMLAPAPATTPLLRAEAQPDAPPLDPVMLAPAPATTPLIPDAPPPLDPAMLTPAAPTTPLAPEPEPLAPEPKPEPWLDPALATPAPATTPLLRAEAQPDLPPLDPAMLAPAPATTPITPEPEPEPAPESASAPQPVAAAESKFEAQAVEPEPTPPPQAAEPEPIAAQPEPTPIEPLPARSAFARVTRPVAELGAALDAFNRVSGNTTPRASAPESGLWERLSQALIERSGAPSSPFAAPQSRPPTPADEEESQQG